MMKAKKLGTFIISFVLMISSFSLKSQSDAVVFLIGGVDDGGKLIQEYLEPLGHSLGANLNGGWYNTAKVHSTLGFDITVSISASIPPETAKTFDLSKLDFENLMVKDPSQSMAPTFAGGKDKGPFLVYKSQPDFEFQTAAGYDLPAYPLPMVKAALGLPKGIEVMGRYLPTVTYEDLSFGLWGAGIKYDIMQHIPIAQRVPFLNASVLGAYTKVTSSADIDFQLSNYPGSFDEVPVEGVAMHYDNQSLEINLQGFTAMGLVSVDLPIICIYAGAGYGQASTNLDLLGKYPVLNHEGGQNFSLEERENPISLKYDDISGFLLNAGIRLKFAVITLHADYTMSDYNMITAGIGISVR